VLGRPEQARDAVIVRNAARSQVLKRIEEALNAAACSIAPFLVGKPETEFKSGGDSLTEADRTANRFLPSGRLTTRRRRWHLAVLPLKPGAYRLRFPSATILNAWSLGIVAQTFLLIPNHSGMWTTNGPDY
jgi:hypothetical protein